jgi:hypothetical protein
MIRWIGIPDRAATILLTVLCTAGITPLAGQQAGGPMRAIEGNAAQATVSSAALPGPRLKPEPLPFEPGFAGSSASARLMLASSGDNHTFVFSTLALVLIGVIIVLLVVR